MKFSTREDIEVPIEFAFARVSDFDAYERRLLRQEVDISRRTAGPVEVGTTWDVAFSFRDRPRRLTAELVSLEPPSGLAIHSLSDGLTLITEIELIALSQASTRVMVSVEAKAKTLAARVLLQSLKLAKPTLTKRFEGRVLGFAREIEDRYRRDV